MLSFRCTWTRAFYCLYYQLVIILTCCFISGGSSGLKFCCCNGVIGRSWVRLIWDMKFTKRSYKLMSCKLTLLLGLRFLENALLLDDDEELLVVTDLTILDLISGLICVQDDLNWSSISLYMDYGRNIDEFLLFLDLWKLVAYAWISWTSVLTLNSSNSPWSPHESISLYDRSCS